MKWRSPLAFVGVVALLVGGAQAESAKVQISGRDCKRLIDHQASGNADYKPGVDVRGRRVVGADLPGSGSTIRLPTTVEFDIAFNPLKGTSAARFAETSAGVGRVKYDISKNQFTFNGEPLDDQATAAIAEKCREFSR